MSMTRKHFEMIAGSLKEATEYSVYKNSAEARSTHALMCNELALDFKMVNPRFDRERFLKACGLGEETIDAL